jgi:hypothetical protein
MVEFIPQPVGAMANERLCLHPSEWYANPSAMALIIPMKPGAARPGQAHHRPAPTRPRASGSALAADIEGANGGYARLRLIEPQQGIVRTLADARDLLSQCRGQRVPGLRFGFFRTLRVRGHRPQGAGASRTSSCASSAFER